MTGDRRYRGGLWARVEREPRAGGSNGPPARVASRARQRRSGAAAVARGRAAVDDCPVEALEGPVVAVECSVSTSTPKSLRPTPERCRRIEANQVLAARPGDELTDAVGCRGPVGSCGAYRS